MRKITLEILLLRGSLGISLKPELARGYVQQCSASAQGFVGEHVGNPNFKWSPVPREAAHGRSCLGERLRRAGPGPSPPAPLGRWAD